MSTTNKGETNNTGHVNNAGHARNAGQANNAGAAAAPREASDSSAAEETADLAAAESGDDYGLDRPADLRRTLRRLCGSVSNQYPRLALVLLSVACYTVFAIAAPLYSADVVDLLWTRIREARAAGQSWSVSWGSGGRELVLLLLLYLAAGGFYFLQSFLMASFAERLSFRASDCAAKLPANSTACPSPSLTAGSPAKSSAASPMTSTRCRRPFRPAPSSSSPPAG